MHFNAHSKNENGETHLLKDHLYSVGSIARKNGEKLSIGDLAYFTALLHDLGKYGHKFQRRLLGLETGIDHWSFGASLAARCSDSSYAFAESAVAIQGHHIGLQKLNKEALIELADYSELTINHPLGLTMSESDGQAIIETMNSDGVDIKIPVLSIKRHTKISDMLDTRMLFSTLVDADFTDTSSHFDRTIQSTAPKLNPEKALKELDKHIKGFKGSTLDDKSINITREKLRNSCISNASSKNGLFTLSAPTGTGKTLSMLSFALKHCIANDLDRIILVIPYLSIIDQTSAIYHKIFKSILSFSPEYIFDHHSNSQISEPEIDEVDYATKAKLNTLASNWDSPIIITTSVQFLQSLFSNKPFACRKLHNMSHSVIMFDEVQTLPARLILPTLSALARLSDRYNSTVVFSTATQPAFSHLSGEVCQLSDYQWEPQEIVQTSEKLYSKSKRVRTDWSMVRDRVTYDDVSVSITSHKQALCVCNLKRQAREIAQSVSSLLGEKRKHKLLYMSTELPQAHRMKVIEDVKRRLDQDSDCLLISTQCIEAGVDIDFPVAYRALGPLDSIAQVAGRCNRNGRNEYGIMYVFKPKEESQRTLYPGDDYANASAITELMLNEMGDIDIEDPKIFTRYYEKLYDLTKSQTLGLEFRNAIKSGDFVKVAKLYKIIEQDTVNILVPYHKLSYKQLANEVRREGISADWIRRASFHSIQIYRTKLPKYKDYIEPVPINKKRMSTDFYIYLHPEHYDEKLGLVVPDTKETMCW